MTQHLSPQQAEEDQRTLRRLAIVVGMFFAATVVMAVTVGVIMS